MKGFARMAAAALLGLLACFPEDPRAQTANEYAVKASFISKFVGFVEWPPGGKGKGGSPERPFVISILGSDPFRADLEKAFRNADLGGRPVRIETLSDASDLSESEVVFISGDVAGQVEKAVRWARQNGALTVGDTDGFAERGVMVNFYVDAGKVRFEINTRAADDGGFQISSLLLKVARIVGGS